MLGLLDIGRHGALGALGDIEFHPGAFFQDPQTARVEAGLMNEKLGAALVGNDESKPLLGIEPFDDACVHGGLPFPEHNLPAMGEAAAKAIGALVWIQ